MTIRMLPDLLTHGDPDLGFPHRKAPAYTIGKANLAPRPTGHAGPGHHDPSHAGAVAVHEWLAHVAAGRIG